jgi:hypothetical protein
MKDVSERTVWDDVRKFHDDHPIIYGVIFLTIIVVIISLPKIVFGAEAHPKPTVTASADIIEPSICRPSGTIEEVCLWSSAVEVQKFKAGFFDRKSGFNPSFVFAEPVHAKEVIVDHITTKLNNQNTPIPANCAGSERCYAYSLYAQIVSDASCVTKGIPTNDAHTCAKTPESSITQQGVINGIDIGLCGFTVAIGIFKGGAGRLIAGTGASLCTWNAWKAATVPAS